MNEVNPRANTAGHPVWTGDVVEITSSAQMIGRIRWRVVASSIAVCVVLFVAMSWSGTDLIDAVIATGLVAFCFGGACVWVAVRSRHWRRHLDALDRTPPATYGSLAWRLWHRAQVESRPHGTLDAEKWINETGSEGPRVILVDTSLPHFERDSQLFEEVPLGASQTLGDKERRTRVKQVGIFLLCIAFAVYGLFTFPATGGFLVQPAMMILLYGCMVVFALYRLGFRPIELGAASAAPGMIRTTRRGAERVYTRADSVLIVRPIQSGLEARVVKVNGEQDRFRFHAGNTDPALHELIERWSWRSDAGATWNGRATRQLDEIRAH